MIGGADIMGGAGASSVRAWRESYMKTNYQVRACDLIDPHPSTFWSETRPDHLPNSKIKSRANGLARAERDELSACRGPEKQA
jgi:hypothetical protein